MSLAEFLDRTDIAVMSAQDAVVAAKAHTTGRIWRINDAERKIAVVTRTIMENTLPRLEAIRDDTTKPIELRELARKLRQTLDTRLLYEPDYFINLGNAEVAAGYAAAVQFGLLTQTELDAFNLAATHIETPFANTTLKDVMAHRNPAQKIPCDHLGQDFVVSIAYQDAFSFVTDWLGETGEIPLTMYWRENAEESTKWKRHQVEWVLLGGVTGETTSQLFNRPAGLNSARHFKFEYLPQYVGQVSVVQVAVGR